MALERLTSPGKIKFNTKSISEDWRKWREEFEIYASLSLKYEEDKGKLQLLKYLMGADGREIYSTLKIDKEEKEIGLKDVLDAFDIYCRSKRNETVERFRFNVRKQKPGETLPYIRLFPRHVLSAKSSLKSCNKSTRVNSSRNQSESFKMYFIFKTV